MFLIIIGLDQNYFIETLKAIKDIRKKDLNSLTRTENLILDQFRYDIRIGVPFVTLFALPIIGYTAPLLALLAPKYLPSTLIMPKQKVLFFIKINLLK